MKQNYKSPDLQMLVLAVCDVLLEASGDLADLDVQDGEWA